TGGTDLWQAYRTTDQFPDICPRRHVPSICACAVRCSISVSVSMLESLTFACHVPVIGGDPAGAEATSADHEPPHTVCCFSAAHVPCKTTRFPSMTVQDPCARFGSFGFTSAIQVPCSTRVPEVARQDPRSWTVDCAAAPIAAKKIATKRTSLTGTAFTYWRSVSGVYLTQSSRCKRSSF